MTLARTAHRLVSLHLLSLRWAPQEIDELSRTASRFPSLVLSCIKKTRTSHPLILYITFKSNLSGFVVYKLPAGLNKKKQCDAW